MDVIAKMLSNNLDSKLTVELANGMAHTIKTEFDKLSAQLQAALDELDAMHTAEDNRHFADSEEE